ncbi:hypothetical protein KRX56_04900 [Dermabacteraceae bacterium TAE3-ERU27]|nr:hypothetical protein [Dermabacteraceae bacterium TAE3-ERU27]
MFKDPVTGTTITVKVVKHTANINRGKDRAYGNLTRRGNGGLGIGQQANFDQYQEVVFTASAPLYGMKFMVQDIDSDSGRDRNYIDSVKIEGPVKATPVNSGFLKVKNLSTGGVELTAPGKEWGGDERPLKDGVDTDGDVEITAKNAKQGIETFTLVYSNKRRLGGNQGITVSAISFYDKASCV